MKGSPFFAVIALSCVLGLVGCGAGSSGSNANQNEHHVQHGSFTIAQPLKSEFNADSIISSKDVFIIGKTT